MTDPERQNPCDLPEPGSPGPSEPAGPPPASAPYEQPPLPGSAAEPYASAGAYPPPPPYGQPFPQPSAQPQQPAQPYGAYPPPPQQPGGQQPPYPPCGAGQQPPYPPYPGQPYPAASPGQPKRKAWPWVLAGCLLVFVLGIGGCVSCTACAIVSEAVDGRYGGYHNSYGYGSDDGYRYGYGDSGGYDGADVDFSIEYIKDMLDLPDGRTVDGKHTPGVYEVGAGKDLEPGLYYVEGDPADEADYVLFGPTSDARYEVDYGVTYFGNYFVELEEGAVFAWDAPDGLRLYPAADASFEPTAPYRSGLYRVGEDIPAGTYTVTIEPEAAVEADNECGAFVMRDLAFGSGSITDEKYVVRGSSQTVTVKDGDWLELYAATAAPAQ